MKKILIYDGLFLEDRNYFLNNNQYIIIFMEDK